MNRLKAIIGISTVAILISIACSNGDISSAAKTENVVLAETSAPLQPAGKQLSYNFDNDGEGKIPGKFHSALTGRGEQGDWVVKTDPTAPSKPNVLAQVSTDNTNYRFPLAIADEGSFLDLDLSVKFKAVSGKEDQAAGLVWRLKDANNYYIVRANALENNVVLYKVENGKRTDLPLKGEGRTYGKKTSVTSGQWNTLRVTAKGNLFEVYLNNEKLYAVEDNTFKDAGKIGLWTKADSVTYFDDLQATAQ
ncbi:MAG: family 16 glycoside hydrolase [Acidobacteriota bacterium]